MREGYIRMMLRSSVERVVLSSPCHRIMPSQLAKTGGVAVPLAQ